MPGRKEVRGGAGTLTLSAALTPSSTSIQANGSTAGWPTGASCPFVVKIDPGGALEKVLCSALSGANPATLVVAQRGFDGTTPLDHQPNVNVQHCIDADSLDTMFDHIFNTTRDDHLQYMPVSGARPFTNVDALTDVPVAIGTAISPGVSVLLARADHHHLIGAGAINSTAMFTNDLLTALQIGPNSITASELADASVDTAALIDHSVTAVKIAFDQQIPTGVMHIWPGSSAALPTGWVLCDGGALNRVTFAALFAVIDTSFGAGDGTTTFNVPDLRGRVPVGSDSMGGADAGRLTGISNTRGATGGEDTHTLIQDEIPDLNVPTFHGGATNTAGKISDAGTSGAGTVSNNANLVRNGTPGQPHNNMQPFRIFNYIIKT